MTTVYPFDPTIPPDAPTIRRIRTLIPDKDAIFGAGKDEYLFDDDTIADFFIEGVGNVKYAAGLAKCTVGSSEALILKLVTNNETKTDGATLGTYWLKAGQALIAAGLLELAANEDDTDYFAIVGGSPRVVPEGSPYEPYNPAGIDPAWPLFNGNPWFERFV